MHSRKCCIKMARLSIPRKTEVELWPLWFFLPGHLLLPGAQALSASVCPGCAQRLLLFFPSSPARVSHLSILFWMVVPRIAYATHAACKSSLCCSSKTQREGPCLTTLLPTWAHLHAPKCYSKSNSKVKYIWETLAKKITQVTEVINYMAPWNLIF